MEASDLFIISIPTHDNRAVPKSVETLIGAAKILGRPHFLNVQQGTGLANTRNKCLQGIRERLPAGTGFAYTFWLDSDIAIEEPAEAIADYVRQAERDGLSFTGSYCVTIDQSKRVSTSVYNQSSVSYDPGELHAAKPFGLRITHAGLGLCYIRMPLAYEFRTQGNDLEDLLFFRDNPEIDARYVPISNFHLKTVLLPFR
jgi:hypothetical protein